MFKLFHAPTPEPGNLDSIMDHAQQSGQACEYEFDAQNAANLASTIADIHMGERLNKFSDAERQIYQGTWLYSYFTNGKGKHH